MTDGIKAIAYLNFFEQLHAPESIIFNAVGNHAYKVFEIVEKILYRYKQLFCNKVIIERPLPSSTVIESDLLHKTNRLQEAGFQWQSSIDEEVDWLLLYCKHHFYAAE